MKHLSFYMAALLVGALATSLSANAAKLDHAHASSHLKNANHYSGHAKSKRKTRHDVEDKVVHLNNATVKELQTLKGVGQKKAELIVAYRKQHGEFSKLDELSSVTGFGQKRLQTLIKNNQGRVEL